MTRKSEAAPIKNAILCTLGVCSVEIHGEVASAIPSNLFRIATYILLSGNKVTISRQRLAALMWPGADHDQAAVNLRQSLARIRRLQEEHGFRLLESSFTLVYLDPENIHWDLQALLVAFSANDEDAVTEICRLYNGDLLAHIPDSGVDFEDWLLEQRALLRDEVIERLMATLDGSMDLSPSVRSQCARKLLDIDPVNERAFQFLMREAAEHGDYARLRKIYARCEQHLMDEFGVASSPQTRSLYRQLIAGEAGS